MKKNRKTTLGSPRYGGLVALVMVTFLAIASVVRAEDAKNLSLQGTLITPPACSLNGDNTVYVPFGDKLSTRKVADGIYRKPVVLDLKCEENTHAWQLTLSYSGAPATFDPDGASVVSAQQEDLGVKLYANHLPLALDKVLKISGTTLPELEAVLVQRPGSELSEGDFTARATLRVAYE
ncbi:fimbrial protein [Citrobacter portucalensis]|uniref:fimbrial protein n=1 Tax=Citrobacter portucalensis TaxID=1639133 RepID=UPI003C2CAB32